MTPASHRKTAGVTDATVKQRTGKTWDQWCRSLDRAGARRLSHREIAVWLKEKHGLGGWWSQMVTVGYEQRRGLRQKHEKPGGFEISRSRTIAAPVGRAFAAWKEPSRRRAWLPGTALKVRTASRNKSLRLTWTDGSQILAVHFAGAGAGRCRVVVQHTKLPNAAAANRAKTFWGKALDSLQGYLEG